MSDLTWIGPTLVGVAAVIQATRAHGKAKEAKDEAAGANRAVNHKDDGQPSIAEQVDSIDRHHVPLLHDQITELRSDIRDTRTVLGVVRREMGSMVNTVGSIKHDLVQHLAHHQMHHEQGDVDR